MVNGLIFENRNNTAENWGKLFKKIFPADGRLDGCRVTFNASTITVSAGYFVMCGRVLQVENQETLQIQPPLQTGYMRLVYRIDLTTAADATTFTQGAWRMDYSSNTDFGELAKEDLNGGGYVYEMEFAAFKIENSSVTECIRMVGTSGCGGKKATVTLTAAGWTAGKTQTVPVQGMAENKTVLYSLNDDVATATQRLQYINAILSAKTQEGGILFSYDGEKPTDSIPVAILDWGVMEQ